MPLLIRFGLSTIYKVTEPHFRPVLKRIEVAFLMNITPPGDCCCRPYDTERGKMELLLPEKPYFVQYRSTGLVMHVHTPLLFACGDSG